MRTADEAYAEHGTAHTIGLQARYMFHTMPKVDPKTMPERLCQVWLDGRRFVTASSLQRAVYMLTEILNNYHQQGGSNCDLPVRFGYVCDYPSGVVTHWIAPNMTVSPLKYLGESGGPEATEPFILR